jgi:nucleotide-binding universal stress UspA family protein
MMFQNVLVGVDGTPNARDAIALATHLIDSVGKLTLVNVHTGELRATRAVTPGRLAEERESSHALLEGERARAGVQAELVSVVASSPGRGLHQEAEEQGADLLVVGSCRHSALGRVMLGDDTRAALNGSPCAVAVAALGYAEHPGPITKVGAGYNASPESESALAAARSLAAATGGAVHALEVVSIPTSAFTGVVPPIGGDTIDLLLEEADARVARLADVEGSVVYGLAGEELAAFSASVDILVVGSRGYGPVRRLVLGSTTDYLERHARCSLLALPRVARAAAEDSPASSQTAAETSAGSSA